MVQSLLTEVTVTPDRATLKLTYADYLRLPDDDLRHEIIDGVHYVTPSPATRHQRIVLRLSRLVAAYLEDHPLGEVFVAPFDVVLSSVDIVVPDVVYLSNERSHLLTDKNLRGAPDLVVEVLSPGTKARDKGLKRRRYELMGVREYWIVDPGENVVTVHRRGGTGFARPRGYSKAGADVLTTDLLPGLEIRLSVLLA